MRLHPAPAVVFVMGCLAFAIGAPPVAAASSDLQRAQQQFKRSCGTCHAVEPDAQQRQGPNLSTIIGRQAGTLAAFTKYSDALKSAGAAGLFWTPETLDPWITNAGKYIPKTNMSYRQRSAEKRALIIAYLKSLQITEAE